MIENNNFPICAFCGTSFVYNNSKTVLYCPHKCDSTIISASARIVCNSCFSPLIFLNSNEFCSNINCPSWKVQYDHYAGSEVIYYDGVPKYECHFLDDSFYINTFFDDNPITCKHLCSIVEKVIKRITKC